MVNAEASQIGDLLIKDGLIAAVGPFLKVRG